MDTETRNARLVRKASSSQRAHYHKGDFFALIMGSSGVCKETSDNLNYLGHHIFTFYTTCVILEGQVVVDEI